MSVNGHAEIQAVQLLTNPSLTWNKTTGTVRYLHKQDGNPITIQEPQGWQYGYTTRYPDLALTADCTWQYGSPGLPRGLQIGANWLSYHSKLTQIIEVVKGHTYRLTCQYTPEIYHHKALNVGDAQVYLVFGASVGESHWLQSPMHLKSQSVTQEFTASTNGQIAIGVAIENKWPLEGVKVTLQQITCVDTTPPEPEPEPPLDPIREAKLKALVIYTQAQAEVDSVRKVLQEQSNYLGMKIMELENELGLKETA